LKPECVIFDFGGVISYPQRSGYFDELSRMLGPEPARLRAAYRRARGEYDRGTLDGPRYWRGVLQEAGAPDGGARLEELIDFDTASWTLINEQTLEEVRRLRGQGRRTAVLSNMPWEIGLAIRRRCSWLKELFEVVTFSCEIGIIKPEPGIYRHTLERLALDAGDCLFVDDTEHNVAGAREVGLPALHFRQPEDLRRALAT
jgi:putative hydrolase of the HAD superfamily